MSIEQYMATIDGVDYVKWEYHKNVNGHLLESTRKVIQERNELKAKVQELSRKSRELEAYKTAWEQLLAYNHASGPFPYKAQENLDKKLKEHP